ncbi:MAG: 3-hydroxyanthranilate 3,4-dioxygenase [Planctomycetota bacterium]|nr:3-hydroxyanthranilate 3,4-dioxygenase [Planctomycetota bacterium]
MPPRTSTSKGRATQRTSSKPRVRAEATSAGRSLVPRKPSDRIAAAPQGEGPAPRGITFPLVHLDTWIRENKANLKPPVSNKQLFFGADDVIVFVSGGPNTRNDYHVNPTEELFYQIKGDIAVRVRPLDGSEPHDVIVREGELFLLPRWVPHRPQRPADTLGLIMEFPRPKGQLDGLRWYCPECDHLVHEATWQLKRIDEDLKIIMEKFWGGPAKHRTCKNCGFVIERAGAIALKGDKVVKKK